MSWIVVVLNENSTKNSYPAVWYHMWDLGVYSSSQGAAHAVDGIGGAAQSGIPQRERSIGGRS